MFSKIFPNWKNREHVLWGAITTENKQTLRSVNKTFYRSFGPTSGYRRGLESPFRVPETSQLFIRTHNEALAVA
jgi:hypothetical protein